MRLSAITNENDDSRATSFTLSKPPSPEKTSQPGLWSLFKARCQETLTHDEATYPLAWQALLTGMVDALIYSRSAIWTGFQTGNMVQFSQNIAQYMLPDAERYPLETLERAVSVTSFIFGSFIGATIGQKFGHQTRGWVSFSAFLQSLMLWGAAAILLALPDDVQPSFQYWPPIIMFTAMSMGLQSVTAQKLSSPAFATTVAFTATLTQIASDPFLFHISLAPIEKVRSTFRNRSSSLEGQRESTIIPKPRTLGRDRRVLGIFALCVGAGVAECLIYSKAGLRGGMAIAAGFKLVQALIWFISGEGQPPKHSVKPSQSAEK